MVKSCEMSEILPCLQVNKLACHHFLDVCIIEGTSLHSQRQRTVYQSQQEQHEDQHLCYFPYSQFQQDDMQRASDVCNMQQVALQERNSELREFESFIMGSKPAYPCIIPKNGIFIILDNKQTYLFSGGRDYFYLLRIFAVSEVSKYFVKG